MVSIIRFDSESVKYLFSNRDYNKSLMEFLSVNVFYK